MKARVRAACLAVLWALGLTLVLEGYARGGVDAALRWAADAPGMFLMAWGLSLGACLLALLFSSLRARCVYGLGLTWGAAMIGLVCCYKMRYRLEPALLSDVHQLSDAWKTVSMLDFQIDVNQIRLCAIRAGVPVPASQKVQTAPLARSDRACAAGAAAGAVHL